MIVTIASMAACGGNGDSTPNSHLVAVSVSGLASSARIDFGLNGSEILTRTGSGRSSFIQRLHRGETWDVRIRKIPAGFSCALSGDKGTIKSSSVTVGVTCSAPSQIVSLVKDVNTDPTDHSSSPASFSVFGNRVAFIASRGSNRQRLFVSDGSPGNATSLIDRDMQQPSILASLDTGLLFLETVNTIAGSFGQLSHHDATTGKTRPLANIHATSAAKLGGRLLFFASDREQRYGSEPWISDGTPSGTRLVKDIRPGRDSAISHPNQEVHVAGDAWFFNANDETGSRNLWRSDGAESGTLQITKSGLDVIKIVGVHSNRVYFFATQPGGTKPALWVTDGGAETEILIQVLAQERGGSIGCFFSANNGVYYVSHNHEGPDISFLWYRADNASGLTRISHKEIEEGRL